MQKNQDYRLACRDFIMGLATLYVMFYHFPFVADSSLFNTVKSLGYGGVDIFVFCSGWGCALSYMRNRNAFEFWGRRLKRILPTWMLFVTFAWVPWYLYTTQVRGLSVLADVVGNVSGLQVFTGKEDVFCWYIGLLILSYLLTPLFCEIEDRWSGLYLIIFILLLMLLSMPFWGTKYLIMVFTRLPLFFLGIVCCNLREDKWPAKQMIAALIVSIIGIIGIIMLKRAISKSVLWEYGLLWYPFFFITPGLTLSLNTAGKKLSESRVNIIYNAVSWIGVHSFELYLIHVLIKKIVSFQIQEQRLSDSNYLWGICFLISVLLAPLLKAVCDRIRIIIQGVRI